MSIRDERSKVKVTQNHTMHKEKDHNSIMNNNIVHQHQTEGKYWVYWQWNVQQPTLKVTVSNRPEMAISWILVLLVTQIRSDTKSVLIS